MHQEIKTQVNPYLTFSGNCREALTFYHEALDGEIELMTFDGSPMEVPDDYKTKIMHGAVKFGDAVIMASDSMPGQEISYGNGWSILINAKSVDEAEKYFDNLSVAGQVTMPLEDTFWGARFGMLTDQFGINWMVSYEYAISK